MTIRHLQWKKQMNFSERIFTEVEEPNLLKLFSLDHACLRQTRGLWDDT